MFVWVKHCKSFWKILLLDYVHQVIVKVARIYLWYFENLVKTCVLELSFKNPCQILTFYGGGKTLNKVGFDNHIFFVSEFQKGQYFVHDTFSNAQWLEILFGQKFIPSNLRSGASPIEQRLENRGIHIWIDEHGKDKAAKDVKIFMGIKRNDVPISCSWQSHTSHIIGVSVLDPEIRGVNVVKGIWAENPQVISVIPAILVHENINVKVKRANNVADNGQYHKVFKHLIKQKLIERLDDVFFDKLVQKIRSCQFYENQVVK